MSAEPSKWAECPKCDPCNPEMDEDGRPYTCFFCGDTGRVLRTVLEAEQREQAEYEARVMNKYRPPAKQLHYGYSTIDDDIPF